MIGTQTRNLQVTEATAGSYYNHCIASSAELSKLCHSTIHGKTGSWRTNFRTNIIEHMKILRGLPQSRGATISGFNPAGIIVRCFSGATMYSSIYN